MELVELLSKVDCLIRTAERSRDINEDNEPTRSYYKGQLDVLRIIERDLEKVYERQGRSS